MTTSQPKGAAALAALEDQGRLFAYPQEVADVIGVNLRTVRLAIDRGEIPHTRVGQRFHIAVAWLRRQVDGEPGSARQPENAGAA